MLQPSGLNIREKLQKYCEMSMLKFAGLLAYGCQGMALLSNEDQKTSYHFGKHLGMGLKVLSDIKSYMKDKVRLESFPVLFAAHEFPQIEGLLHSGARDAVKRLVEQAHGVEWARKLAIQHLSEALATAESFSQRVEVQSQVGVLAKHLY